jgi:hypothetical protein
MIEIGAAAACFERLTAPENASNGKFQRFAPGFIRKRSNSGPRGDVPDHLEFS